MQSYLTHVHSVGMYCVQYRNTKKLKSNTYMVCMYSYFQNKTGP